MKNFVNTMFALTATAFLICIGGMHFASFIDDRVEIKMRSLEIYMVEPA